MAKRKGCPAGWRKVGQYCVNMQLYNKFGKRLLRSIDRDQRHILISQIEKRAVYPADEIGGIDYDISVDAGELMAIHDLID